MATLSFKKQYIAPILDGSKVQTLRAGTLLQPGDLVSATCVWTQPPFALLEVQHVSEVGLEDLTHEDAIADGFPDLDSMRQVLHKLYPGVDRFAKIAFCVVDPEGAV